MFNLVDTVPDDMYIGTDDKNRVMYIVKHIGETFCWCKKVFPDGIDKVVSCDYIIASDKIKKVDGYETELDTFKAHVVELKKKFEENKEKEKINELMRNIGGKNV